MGKNYDELKDLTPEQLMAQIKLCFKFMAQCHAILEGEDIKDEAAIKLVDPTGDCEDMELFYACKSAVKDGSLSDAMETIAAQDKKIAKLQKRLAKKHEAEVNREERKSAYVTFSEFLNYLSGNLRPKDSLLAEIRDYARGHQRANKPQPKYKKGDKVFFMYEDAVKSGVIAEIPVWVAQYQFFGYHVETPDGVYRMEEKYLFSDLAQLFNHLKENVNGNTD